ncbi:autotransporter assembly complex protein TamA [Yoonia sediminilitoris]|uniref:Autotransporter secretion outer membrane protein TamA n=1 Tax=Yoonia sediminilitoris TaxID=1286148 RepID=A0A2T6KMC5_9RHOB|nr:autotransporter assembly complex family protein [Yoonia sediminilitoris]PUB17363.1 autotransporter secretion outer membrane protein TamA [Yoonia sediminilitoris]RCW97658.1 autotransporter secretion outer membrane protein TamA [Yoonia sediminilitoris]
MRIKVLVSVFAFSCAGALQAQDVSIKTDEAWSELNAASLLRQLEEGAVPQDYVAAARADYRRLLTALYGEGFYGSTISITIDGVEASSISPLGAPSVIRKVVIEVDAGPRFKFGRLAISPVPQTLEFPEEFRRGRTAETRRIKEAVSLSLDSWRDLGYPKVTVAEQRIVARHPKRRLDVDVALDTGPRLTFGALTPNGNRNVRDERIVQIAGLPTGEVYSPQALEMAERRLRRTGAFDSVALQEADEIGPGDTLPITAQVAEAKLRRIGFGLELSSIDGVTVSAFWLHRNLLGGAERARLNVEVAGIDGQTGGTDYAIQGQFTRPASFGPDTEYYFKGEIAREDEPNYLLDKISLETGLSRIINDDLTVQAGVGLLRASEESEIGSRDYTLLTLPLEATLDRRNDPTNASQGYFIDLTATPFVSADGEVAGARLFSDTRGYVEITESLTFGARAQIGSVIGADLDEAPADFLFYSGGGGTVRGQPYQSLGVDRVINGQTISTGGDSFVGTQLEARYGINDALSVVGFYDAGFVGETQTPLEDGDWHAGAGFGLRYNTGIGPIRFDVATPASGDNAGEEVQVYIGIGQAF